MQKQQLRDMGVVSTIEKNGKEIEYVNLYAINDQIGNTKSTIEASAVEINMAVCLLRSRKWSLTPNTANAKVATNLLYDAKIEMEKTLSEKDALIEELKKKLKKQSKSEKNDNIEEGSYV